MGRPKSKLVKVESLGASLALGRRLGQNLKGGEVIELSSDLGGGKTTLVKGIAAGAGSKDLVSSPSFTICNQYKASGYTIYHFDFYRLNDPGIIRRELQEVLGDPKIVVVIEWPISVEDSLPPDRLSISLQATGEQTRDMRFECSEDLGYLLIGLK
jgi:tRNA threonylcarbamoyladenosine biosynthesis protein TsaE